jgi:outer membrane protein OmpA-like peptidoglycan-associated protein
MHHFRIQCAALITSFVMVLSGLATSSVAASIENEVAENSPSFATGSASTESVSSSSCALPGARSELVGSTPGEELFLGGNYIELGISNLGNFGTASNKPSGFYGANRGAIGMTADYDGFNCGLSYPIDFFLPGGPEERYNFGFDIAGSRSYASLSTLARSFSSGVLTIPSTSDVVVTNESSGTTLRGKIVTSFKDSNSALVAVVTQSISFGVDDKYFLNSILIENLSGSTWSSVRYMRNVDPDNAKDQGANYTTDNEVISTIAIDGAAVIRAQIQSSDSATTIPTNFSGSLAPLLYYSRDSGAKVSAYGFTNTNPYETVGTNNYDNPLAKGSLANGDIGINITIQGTNLASGSSLTTNYVTSLDERSFAAIETELVRAIEVAAGAPPAVASASVPPMIANGYRADKLGTVYFAPLSSKLSKSAKSQLEALVAANPANIYKVTGHVQKSIFAKNAKNDASLSLARARAIETYLVSLGAGVNFTVVVDAGKVPAKNGKSSKARRATLYAMTPVVQ